MAWSGGFVSEKAAHMAGNFKYLIPVIWTSLWGCLSVLIIWQLVFPQQMIQEQGGGLNVFYDLILAI